MIETKRGLALLVVVFALSGIASAQVNFRDDAGFNFYDNLNMESSANISMNGNRILGLPSAQSSGEPLTLGGGSGDFVDRQGDNMEGDLDMKNNLVLGDRATIDFNSGELTLNQDMPASGSPTTIQLNQDGNPNWALVSMQDGGLGIYDLQNNQFVQEFNENGPTEISNEKLRVTTGELALSGCNLSSSTNSLKLSSCNMNLDGSDLTNVNFITGNGGSVNYASEVDLRGNNLELSGGYISNDGDNEGISIDNNGDITVTGELQTNGPLIAGDGPGRNLAIWDSQSSARYWFETGDYDLDIQKQDGSGGYISALNINGDTGATINSVEIPNSPLSLLGNDLTNVNFITGDGGDIKLSNILDMSGNNIELSGAQISNDGDNEGISVDNGGDVGIGTTGPQTQLDLGGGLRIPQLSKDTVSGDNFNNRLTFGNPFAHDHFLMFQQEGSGGASTQYCTTQWGCQVLMATDSGGGINSNIAFGAKNPDTSFKRVMEIVGNTGNMLMGGDINMDGNDISNIGFLLGDGGQIDIGDNLALQGDYLSNDGDNEGVGIDNSGNTELTGDLELLGGEGVDWENDAYGGGGDDAFIDYTSEGGENTKLEIGINNDKNDNLVLTQGTQERIDIQGGDSDEKSQVNVKNSNVDMNDNSMKDVDWANSDSPFAWAVVNMNALSSSSGTYATSTGFTDGGLDIPELDTGDTSFDGQFDCTDNDYACVGVQDGHIQIGMVIPDDAKFISNPVGNRPFCSPIPLGDMDPQFTDPENRIEGFATDYAGSNMGHCVDGAPDNNRQIYCISMESRRTDSNSADVGISCIGE